MYNYSQRLIWDQPANAFNRLVEEQRQAGALLLDLTSANPTEVFDNYPHVEIRQAYAKINDFTYRPDPFGSRPAREAIANWYGRRGVRVSPEQLALTDSTSEAYALLFKLLSNPGDEVVVPTPSYPLFEYLARLESVEIVPYRLLYDGSWFIDFASLRAAISKRTRAIVVVNPNNPTGSFLKIHETAMLLEIAQEHNLPLISDEVFMEYSFEKIGDGQPRLLCSDYLSSSLANSGASVGPQFFHRPDRTRTLIGCDHALSFSLGGLSKSAGMPQMKLAWIAINGEAGIRADVRSRLELLLDTYLPVTTPAQNALGDLLEIGDSIARRISVRMERNRAALDDILRGTPVHTLHAEGGWSAILQLPKLRTEDAWMIELITRQHVLVQPGYFFDMPSEPYAIVSLLTPENVLAEGIERLRKAIPE